MLESGSWGHSVLQTPALVHPENINSFLISPQKHVVGKHLSEPLLEYPEHMFICYAQNICFMDKEKGLPGYSLYSPHIVVYKEYKILCSLQSIHMSIHLHFVSDC